MNSSTLLEELFTQLALVILEARADGEEEVVILTDSLRDAITATAQYILREHDTGRVPGPPLVSAARVILTAYSPALLAREEERAAEEFRARMAAKDRVNPYAARSYTRDEILKLFPFAT